MDAMYYVEHANTLMYRPIISISPQVGVIRLGIYQLSPQIRGVPAMDNKVSSYHDRSKQTRVNRHSTF